MKENLQILESLARKWNTLERNGLATVPTWLKQRESITPVKAKEERDSTLVKARGEHNS